jgi:YD repeat-containing protein
MEHIGGPRLAAGSIACRVKISCRWALVMLAVILTPFDFVHGTEIGWFYRNVPTDKGPYSSYEAACQANLDDYVRSLFQPDFIVRGYFSNTRCFGPDVWDPAGRPIIYNCGGPWALTTYIPNGNTSNNGSCNYVYREGDTCTPPKSLDPITGACEVSPKNPPACPATGNPVSVATGNKYQQELDYSGANRQGTLRFERHYNSASAFGVQHHVQGVYAGAFRPLGLRWAHSWMRFVIDDKGIAYVHRANGQEFPFRKAGTVWQLDGDINYALTETVSDDQRTGWILTTPEGDTETYDTNGFLQSITYFAGITETFTYSTGQTPISVAPFPNLLLGVSNSLGQAATFNYDTNGRLTKFSDPSNAQINYSYDTAGNLSTVQYPDGKTRTYVYNESANTAGANLPNALTGIIDENGQRYATWTYDTSGRAISSEHAGSAEKVGLGYNPDGTTTVSDYKDDPNTLNSTRTYTFQTILGVIKSTGVTQPCPTCGGTSAQATTYDANGSVASRTDFNGHRTNTTYDLTRNLETRRVAGLTSSGATTAQTRTISTAWHPTWRLPTTRAEPKRLTTYLYDDTGSTCGAQGALCSKTEQATTDANGAQGLTPTLSGSPRTWTYTYNAQGQVLSVDGPRTDVTDKMTYTYYTTTDVNGNYRSGDLASFTNALNQTTQITAYDTHGRPKTIVDPNGLTTQLTYDPRGRLTRRTVGSEVTNYTYDGVGQLTQVSLPDGAVIHYTYDAAHRLTDIQDSLGNTLHYTLDLMGNRTREEIKDPQGTLKQTRARIYDSLNRLSQDLGALPGETTSYTYTPNGERLTTTDALNRTTTNRFDALNRLQQMTDPTNAITQYAYDGQDHLTQVTDARGHNTTYTLDGLGNRTQEISPETGTTVSTYDEAGNLSTRTDAKQQVTRYSYDALNRIVRIVYHDGHYETYTYDQGPNGIGRLSTLAEFTAQGSLTAQTSYGYEAHGRVIQESRQLGSNTTTVSYHYDAGGRLDRMVYPSGRSLNYAFDTHGRIQRIDLAPFADSPAQTVVSSLQYQPFGGVASFSYGNGQNFQRHYDLDGRIQDYTLGPSTIGVGYDLASQLTSLTDGLTNQVNQYDYDPVGRLVSALTPTLTRGYDYDATGNRLTQTGGSVIAYGIDPASNQLTRINSNPQSFDANGSLTTSTTGLSLSYDVRGRLVHAQSGGVGTDYQLDALGRRVRKTTASGETQYVYDLGGHLIAETGPSGTVLKEYLYLNDLPIAVLAH